MAAAIPHLTRTHSVDEGTIYTIPSDNAYRYNVVYYILKYNVHHNNTYIMSSMYHIFYIIIYIVSDDISTMCVNIYYLVICFSIILFIYYLYCPHCRVHVGVITALSTS